MLCTAVLVLYRTGAVWVESDNIGTLGRIEESLSVGDIDDRETAISIGEAFLQERSLPLDSFTVELTSQAPLDFDLGDTLEADGTVGLRCVGKTYDLNDDGTLAVLPELNSPLAEKIKRRDARVDRMIEAVGGTFGAAAPPVDVGTKIPTGKLNTIKLHSWSWGFAEDLDNPWEAGVAEGDGGTFGDPFTVEEPCRLYEWVIECRTHDDDDIQLTYGDTEFEIYLDDSPLSPPFIITLGDTDTKASQQVYGPGLLVKGQILRPINRLNGGHEQGTITFHATDPV